MKPLLDHLAAAVLGAVIVLCPWTWGAEGPEEGFVTTSEGVKIYFRKAGTGQPTVLIPNAIYMEQDFAKLAKGRTVILYDMRNRGRSSTVSDGTKLTIQADVDDLEQLRKHFRLSKFIPIGYSYLGLMVAMYAAQHPERVERLVQIGPVPRKFGTEYPRELTNGPETLPAKIRAKGAELAKLRDQGFDKNNPKAFCERQAEFFSYWMVGDPANASKIPKVCQYDNELPLNFERHLQFHFGDVQRLDVPKERFAAIPIPVLTIHGRLDRNSPYGAGREWALTFPNGRLITVPNGAHHVWADDPTVLDDIDTFLRGDWPKRAERITKLLPVSTPIPKTLH
ncbi:MAG TPA: alpha/beta hydrolase [Terriglobales bacterium]|jgi:proline iminopeptidase|nr:alpha/beta hydrolase [Terriglobales bacterium]